VHDDIIDLFPNYNSPAFLQLVALARSLEDGTARLLDVTGMSSAEFRSAICGREDGAILCEGVGGVGQPVSELAPPSTDGV
jgi:hypothetical protein